MSCFQIIYCISHLIFLCYDVNNRPNEESKFFRKFVHIEITQSFIIGLILFAISLYLDHSIEKKVLLIGIPVSLLLLAFHIQIANNFLFILNIYLVFLAVELMAVWWIFMFLEKDWFTWKYFFFLVKYKYK